MPNYLWLNKTTGEHRDIQAKITDRDTPPDDSGLWERILEAPMVMNAAFPDGVRKDTTDFKKIAKLQASAADLDRSDPKRNEIQAEITARKRLK